MRSAFSKQGPAFTVPPGQKDNATSMKLFLCAYKQRTWYDDCCGLRVPFGCLSGGFVLGSLEGLRLGFKAKWGYQVGANFDTLLFNQSPVDVNEGQELVVQTTLPNPTGSRRPVHIFLHTSGGVPLISGHQKGQAGSDGLCVLGFCVGCL